MAQERREIISIDWLALWVLFSAWCSLSGWSLSLLGCLKPTGVGTSLIIFLLGITYLRRSLIVSAGSGAPFRWKTFHSRRILPKIWLLLAFLALIGGLLYHPTNYDYLSYRFPRVLYWCGEQRWFWIPTVNPRMNYSGTGMEWLMVPLVSLFKTDRLFFLINFISYLFLPGLIFSVLSGLGVSRRISWWWMWILPCGYCYILQAASAGNDSFAAIYGLAAFHYLFQARTSATTRNLALSCLAIALLTGAKASNLPLVLPWMIAVFFNRKRFLEKGNRSILVVALFVAAAVSFLPTGLLNINFTGDYSGDPTNRGQMKITHPISGVIGNSLQMALGNLAPPLSPVSVSWESLVPSTLLTTLHRDFPRLDLNWGQMQMEETAGAGLGVALLCALLLAFGIQARVSESDHIKVRDPQALWIVGGVVVALLVYMAKIGSESTPRLLAAYYPFLVAGLLIVISLDGRIIHRTLFQWIGVLAMLGAYPLVIVSPARPLFPAQTVSHFLARGHVSPVLVERYNRVYTVYATRADLFSGVTGLVPPTENVLGILAGGNDPVASFWIPFGTRRIIEVTPNDSAQELKNRGIHYVIVNQDQLSRVYNEAIADLASKWSAHVVAEKSFVLRIQQGPVAWSILDL